MVTQILYIGIGGVILGLIAMLLWYGIIQAIFGQPMPSMVGVPLHIILTVIMGIVVLIKGWPWWSCLIPSAVATAVLTCGAIITRIKVGRRDWSIQ